MRKRCVLAVLTAFFLLFTGCGKTVSDLPIFVDPASATVQTGQTVQFEVVVDGNPYSKNLTWLVNDTPGGNATVGTISAQGLYMAPRSVPNPNKVTVAVRQDGVNQKGEHIFISVEASVTITGSGSSPNASIDVSPSVIAPGQSATLTWSSANVTACTINGQKKIQGVSVGTSGSVQVSPPSTTTYQLDCTGPNGPASDLVTLTVQSSKITVSISPSTGTLPSGETMQFTATVNNDPSGKGVHWAASLGDAPIAIDAFNAIYTAPSVSQNTTVTITATSVTDPTATASATITVTPGGQGPPQAGIDPTIANIKSGASLKFTATISGQGVTNQNFTWSLRPAQGVDPKDVGTITPGNPSNTATYTAAKVSSLVTVQVIATSVQFPNVAAYATVTIAP